MDQSISDALTTCRTCRAPKPADAFYSDRSKPQGHGTECKECCRARTKVRYESDRDAWKKRTAENKAANAERYRRYNREYAARNRARTADREAKYRSDNRDAYRAHQRAWYERNGEEARAVGRINASARRARMRSNGSYVVTAEDLDRALTRTGGACAYCGAYGPIHWDHVVPLARGGAHSIGNLVPACAPCNQQKSSKTVMEWRVKSRRA